MVLDFKDFCSQLDENEILLCDDKELLKYSRTDLQQKENLVELIGYPDNMMDEWDKYIGSLVSVPCVWILHDKDNCDSHIHIIVSWSNNVQMSYYLKYLNQVLRKEGINPKTGKLYCPFKLIQPVKYPERSYNYLIHDTEDSRDKYQYSPLERHHENGFDIHFVKQLDTKKKYLISRDIAKHIRDYKVMDLIKLMDWIDTQNEDYFLVYQAQSGFFDRLCAGNWKEFLRNLEKKKSQQNQ